MSIAKIYFRILGNGFEQETRRVATSWHGSEDAAAPVRTRASERVIANPGDAAGKVLRKSHRRVRADDWRCFEQRFRRVEATTRHEQIFPGAAWRRAFHGCRP